MTSAEFSEYEGWYGMDERLVNDVVGAAKKVRDALRALGPLPPPVRGTIPA